MGYLLKAVFQIAAFLLFQTVLLNLVEQSRYEKYIRIFSGFLLILLLFSAVQSLYAGESLIEEVGKRVEYVTEGEDFQLQLRQAEENQRKQIQEEYEKRVLQEAENCLAEERYFLVSGKVSFSDNWETEMLELVVSRTWKGDSDTEAAGETASPVETVRIEPVEQVEVSGAEHAGEAGHAGGSEGDAGTEAHLNSLAYRLSGRLGISAERIVLKEKE